MCLHEYDNTQYIYLCAVFFFTNRHFEENFFLHANLSFLFCVVYGYCRVPYDTLRSFSTKIFSRTWYSRTQRNSSPKFPSFKIWNCFPLPLKVANHHSSSRGLKRPTQWSRVLYFFSGNGWCQCWSVFSEHSKLVMVVDKSIVSK